MADKETLVLKEMIALHKHWLHADSIKVRISAEIIKEKEKPADFPKWLQEFGAAHSMFLAISVWYALIYVVIEGYKAMALSDEAIDELLSQEDYVDVLRRFRNAIFHYQSDPISEKLLGFLNAEDSEIWIRKLNVAFNAFFTNYAPINEFLTATGVLDDKQ